ncbi:FabD/lysophospholipase-like protein, partial [Ceratobasidium sp. AG-I]
MQSLQNAGNLPTKPSIKKVFQMVVGTGTGGIIGLMGGKLDMNTDDMMREFSMLGKKVFREDKLTITNGSPNARQYKKMLRKIVEKYGGDADKRMLDEHPEDGGCLVAVTAMAPHNLDNGIPSVLRTYQTPEDQLLDCAIWEAMCATSANHGLFKSMEIGPSALRERFVNDGYSNPMAILLLEAKRMFPNRHISCVVGIGDGQVSIVKMPDRDLVRRMLLSQSTGICLRMATNCEQIMQEMEMRFQDTVDVFFRLDLEQGAQDTEVDKWNRLNDMGTHSGLNSQSKYTDEQIGKAATSILAKRANIPTAQLDGVIQRAISAIPIMSQCPEPTKLFTGCAGKLKKIQKYLTGDPAKQKVFVVHGISGAGKTQLVLEFSRRSQDRIFSFSEILYIDSSSQQNISLGLKGLAALKNLEPTNNSALRWLASPSRNWLLIFDNVDDPTVRVQDYFPRCSHGSIVVITQDCDLQRLAEGSKSCCQVGKLDPESALELLLKAAHLDGNKISKLEMVAASEIGKDLGYLALAIVQAGAYILRSGCSLAQYRQNYQDRSHELKLHHIVFPEAEDYQLNIYATWKLSLDRLRPKSKGLLQLISLLHHNRISTSIFEHASLNA